MSILATQDKCFRCDQLTDCFSIYCVVDRRKTAPVCESCLEDEDLADVHFRYEISLEEWERKKVAFLKYIGLCPGSYSVERMAKALNVSNRAVEHMRLQLRHEVVLVLMAFAKSDHNCNYKFYLTKDAPHPTKARQQRLARLQQVKVTHDPTLRGSWEPLDKRAKTPARHVGKHIETLKHVAQEEDVARTREQIDQHCESALQQLISQGVPFTKAEFLNLSGLARSKFWDDSYKEIRDKVEQAILDLQAKADDATAARVAARHSEPAAEPAAPNPTEAEAPHEPTQSEPAAEPPPEPAAEPLSWAEIDRLRMQLEELKQQNYELRKQQARPPETGIPLSWLQTQAALWRAAIETYEADLAALHLKHEQEMQQARADIDAAHQNLLACERLITLSAGEPPAALVALATANHSTHHAA